MREYEIYQNMNFEEKNEMISRLNSLRDARKDRHVGIGELEANWTDIVKKEGLSRRCAEQQAAIWEIVTTEYRYLQVFIIIYLTSFSG